MTDINDKIGLAELLDRTLKKGVILNADLVITVADVPLLAANLRLALANVETMLKYGMMEDLLLPLKRKEDAAFPAASGTALPDKQQAVEQCNCDCCKYQQCSQ